MVGYQKGRPTIPSDVKIGAILSGGGAAIIGPYEGVGGPCFDEEKILYAGTRPRRDRAWEVQLRHCWPLRKAGHLPTNRERGTPATCQLGVPSAIRSITASARGETRTPTSSRPPDLKVARPHAPSRRPRRRPGSSGVVPPTGVVLREETVSKPQPIVEAMYSARPAVGSAVFARGVVGKIEASATTRPCVPWTRPLAFTTAIRSLEGPIRHVPTGCQ